MRLANRCRHRRCCRRRVAAGAGVVRPHPARRPRAAELAVVLGHAVQPALQPAHADHAGERRRTCSCSGSGRRGRSRSSKRRRSSSTACMYTVRGAEQRRRARRRDRPAVLDVHLHAGARRAPLLRPREPRRRDSRRHAVHGHDRRAPDRHRREERAAALERRRRRGQGRATRSRTRR